MRPSRPVLLALALLGAASPAAAQRDFGEERFADTCRPPLKFAAGACVATCPSGYDDRGRVCESRRGGGGGGGPGR